MVKVSFPIVQTVIFRSWVPRQFQLFTNSRASCFGPGLPLKSSVCGKMIGDSLLLLHKAAWTKNLFSSSWYHFGMTVDIPCFPSLLSKLHVLYVARSRFTRRPLRLHQRSKTDGFISPFELTFGRGGVEETICQSSDVPRVARATSILKAMNKPARGLYVDTSLYRSFISRDRRWASSSVADPMQGSRASARRQSRMRPAKHTLSVSHRLSNLV